MLTLLIFDVILSIPAEQRKKAVSVVCTDSTDFRTDES